MTTAFLVPSLVQLRTTFNGRFPQRDKTSDGWIGDAAHQLTSSKHNPDAEGRVHAIDVDRDLRDDGGVAMQDVIDRILTNQRAGDRRLQNIIFNRRIWSRSWGWTPRDYDGENPHEKHAHFECRLLDAARNATYSWPMPPHNIPEDLMAFADEKIPITITTGVELFEPDKPAGTEVSAATILQLAAIHSGRAARKIDLVLAKLDQLAGADNSDEQAVIAGVLAGLNPQAIAAAVAEALPADQAQKVVDELASRLRTNA